MKARVSGDNGEETEALILEKEEIVMENERNWRETPGLPNPDDCVPSCSHDPSPVALFAGAGKVGRDVMGLAVQAPFIAGVAGRPVPDRPSQGIGGERS
jgi:hypothetical protein